MSKKLKTNNYYGTIPISMITAELEGLYGQNILAEMREIIGYYEAYEKGAEFNPESSEDYIPANLNYRYIKTLIDKEAAFMFSMPLDFNVDADNLKEDDSIKEAVSNIQSFLHKVIKRNLFNTKVLPAAKDFLIGKRIALVVNFNEETGISISFSPSLEFVYETDPSDVDRLTKLVLFYQMVDTSDKGEQRIYKKKYEMREDGFCHITEEVYDGVGNVVEIVIDDTKTKFDYIPGIVIVNDALTGDLQGNSDVATINDYESWYSRLGSADIDTMRKGMNPIRYTVDMDSMSTSNLPINAGAYWDLQSNQNIDEPKSQVGVLENDLGFSEPLRNTLDRLKGMMYNQLSIPDVSSEALSGVITSGKSLKAIYWELIIRCEEKLTVWKPALEFMAKTIIEGAKLYPNVKKLYTDHDLNLKGEYIIEVENNYPIPEDEELEKQTDLAEVNAQTMSKKTYMRKWRRLTDREADEELKQIALEKELLEDSYGLPFNADKTVETGEGEIGDEDGEES